MLKAFLACLLLCAMCAAGWAQATYYVAPNGSDKTPGTSEQPFATIQKAADAVRPGDTVIVRDGTYTGAAGQWTNIVHLNQGGTADQPIVFKAEHKWGAVLDGRGNATGFGIAFDAGGRGRDYVTIQDFEIRDTCYHISRDWQDPRFVDCAGNPKVADLSRKLRFDFRLTDKSPGIDQGIADLAPARDYDGKRRPQGKGVDIGAFER